jgi:hypothetical protein
MLFWLESTLQGFASKKGEYIENASQKREKASCRRNGEHYFEAKQRRYRRCELPLRWSNDVRDVSQRQFSTTFGLLATFVTNENDEGRTKEVLHCFTTSTEVVSLSTTLDVSVAREDERN